MGSVERITTKLTVEDPPIDYIDEIKVSKNHHIKNFAGAGSLLWPSSSSHSLNGPSKGASTEKYAKKYFSATLKDAGPRHGQTIKHNNTIKYLIAITPAGAISISVSWDEVLADRGFLIRDELAAYGATLTYPSFHKRRRSSFLHRKWTQLDNFLKELLVGGKTLRLCQTVIPVSQVNILDDVVIVCGALTNLCKCVVPK
ncbi:hypothetical protein N1851_006042 [Merluccius polli]|uniref:DDE Tnp4 domain-containing protein n=1 Tax=Merluccius polli TaxID=89951 RepID=A0AA47N5W1_MERPO|nr:hypothetical protein N1851_006042 [Merluccius polli]